MRMRMYNNLIACSALNVFKSVLTNGYSHSLVKTIFSYDHAASYQVLFILPGNSTLDGVSA